MLHNIYANDRKAYQIFINLGEMTHKEEVKKNTGEAIDSIVTSQ